MIKLIMDEGFAFDVFSVNEIKYAKGIIDIRRYNILKDNLIEEVGEEKFFAVVNSPEYKELMDANLHTFGLVDLVKEDKVLGSAVHNGNDWRFVCKTKIMAKFFPDKIQLEQKN